MQKTIIKLPEIKLVGIKVRTSYQNELNWQNGKLFPCTKKYFHESISEKITNRRIPGRTLCIYTEYKNDFRDEYSYFIGEEVTSFDNNLPEDLETLTIKPQTYAKFTTQPGAMPEVVRGAWEKIWNMNEEELGGKRNYYADFEIYDERSSDHQNIILDIYIGVEG